MYILPKILIDFKFNVKLVNDKPELDTKIKVTNLELKEKNEKSN